MQVSINSDALTSPRPDSEAGTLNLGSISDPQDVKVELNSASPVVRPKLGPKSAMLKKPVKPEVEDSQDPPTPEMEGNEPEGGEPGGDEDWCAVCHDGGDLLYCCDRCPKVYHLYCYIPPLTSEPPDDWVCLMCATYDEIQQFPNKKGTAGNLGDRDLKICRRLLFELYNKWPESVPFRDCGDLNFPEYLAVVKEPIALDVIKERLSADNPEQYESVAAFLKDLRRMFRNCFSFHSKDTEFYRHAKHLEETLDRELEIWMPDLAYDVSLKEVASAVSGPKKKNR